MKTKLLPLLPSLISLLSCPVSGETANEPPRLALWRHSIDFPHQLRTSPDWRVAGSVTAEGHRMALVPSVAGHVGQIWSQLPLVGDSIEVTFAFEIGNGPEAPPIENPKTQGFAIWYSPVPITQLAAQAPRKEDWTLFGHYNQFKGLGVFFALHDRKGSLNPSISAAVGDGRVWNVNTDVPSEAGVYWKIHDTAEPMLFRLNMAPGQVLGHARFMSSPQWTRVFQLDTTLPPGGYLGISASSGVGGSENDVSGERIVLWDFKVHDTNPASPPPNQAPPQGQQMQLMGDPMDAARRGAYMGSEGLLKPGADGKVDVQASLQMLASLMARMMAEIVPRQVQMNVVVNEMENHMMRLTHLVSEVQRKVGAGGQSADVAVEISSLKQLLDTHSLHQQKAAQSLLEVGRAMKESSIPQRGDSTRHLESIQAHMRRQNALHWCMLLLFIGVTFVSVVVAWKKTREWEKKHLF